MLTHQLDGLRINTDTFSRMPILHPVTKKPVLSADKAPAYIELSPFESPAGRAIDRLIQDENFKRGRPATRDENDSAFVDKLTAITKGWHLVNLATGESMDAPCTSDMVRAVYTHDDFLWLKAQVVVYAADLGNFPGVVSTV